MGQEEIDFDWTALESIPEFHECKHLSARIAKIEGLDKDQPMIEAVLAAARQELHGLPEPWPEPVEVIDQLEPAKVRDVLLLRLIDPPAFWALLPPSMQEHGTELIAKSDALMKAIRKCFAEDEEK